MKYSEELTMSDKSAIATEMFSKGYNCAQSVFYAFREEVGLDENTALKLACGLGAGMGRKEEVCGAITGGILVLGMMHGRGSKDKDKSTELTYQKTRELMESFAEKHGSYICRQLLDGCDLTTKAGQSMFKERNMRNTVCKGCIQSAVAILEKIK
jgi:C_GCAxxG_C_C family probable redox protein